MIGANNGRVPGKDQQRTGADRHLGLQDGIAPMPTSSEMICAESIRSPTTCAGSKSVANMVSSGLVRPIVNTTSNKAMLATFLRGVFMTGDNCEILSRPEKARNEPAKPTRRAGRVSF